MTTSEAIERVARMKPNAVRDSDIADWILDLNTRLVLELNAEAETPQSWPEDGDVALFAEGAYAELYVFYAVAMIEYYQREYANYNNSIILFNDRMADFRRYWRRNHLPEETGGWQNVL